MTRGVYERTKEHRERYSKIMKIVMNKPEVKEKISKALKGEH